MSPGIGPERAGGEPMAVASVPGWISGLGRLVAGLLGLAQAASALAVLLAMLVIVYGVLMRYLAGQPILWADSVVSYLLVLIVMLGAASALRAGQHVAVDVLVERLGPSARRMMHALAMLSVLLVGVYLVVDGWSTVMFSRMLGITTSGEPELPVFWLQLLLPVGGVLLCLAAIESLLRLCLGLTPHAAESRKPLSHAQPDRGEK